MQPQKCRYSKQDTTITLPIYSKENLTDRAVNNNQEKRIYEMGYTVI